MNKDHFYHQFIDVADVEETISTLSIDEDEKDELLAIFYKTLHLEVVNFVLEELPVEHHQSFLYYLDHKPQDRGLMVFLRRSIEDLEDRLQSLATQLKHDFKEALHDYQSASEEWLEGV